MVRLLWCYGFNAVTMSCFSYTVLLPAGNLLFSRPLYLGKNASTEFFQHIFRRFASQRRTYQIILGCIGYGPPFRGSAIPGGRHSGLGLGLWLGLGLGTPGMADPRNGGPPEWRTQIGCINRMCSTSKCRLN